MKIKYTEKIVRLGSKTYKVIIPDETDGFVNGEYIMDGDRKAFQAIAFSMMHLIENKDTIIYFNLWNNKPAKIMYKWERSGKRCENFDVVFMSHALQFKIKDWKEIRNKLKKTKAYKHSEKFNLDWASGKAERLKSKFEKKEIYIKQKDRFNYRFEYDTHFFVGGVQSFTELFIDISEYLKTNLEQYYMSFPDMEWTFLPQFVNRKLRFDDPMEIGFWDRRFEEVHEREFKKGWR